MLLIAWSSIILHFSCLTSDFVPFFSNFGKDLASTSGLSFRCFLTDFVPYLMTHQSILGFSPLVRSLLKIQLALILFLAVSHCSSKSSENILFCKSIFGAGV